MKFQQNKPIRKAHFAQINKCHILLEFQWANSVKHVLVNKAPSPSTEDFLQASMQTGWHVTQATQQALVCVTRVTSMYWHQYTIYWHQLQLSWHRQKSRNIHNFRYYRIKLKKIEETKKSKEKQWLQVAYGTL